jgi:hypothetical protein
MVNRLINEELAERGHESGAFEFQYIEDRKSKCDKLVLVSSGADR